VDTPTPHPLWIGGADRRGPCLAGSRQAPVMPAVTPPPFWIGTYAAVRGAAMGRVADGRTSVRAISGLSRDVRMCALR
jgi:hypothetical protein